MSVIVRVEQSVFASNLDRFQRSHFQDHVKTSVGVIRGHLGRRNERERCEMNVIERSKKKKKRGKKKKKVVLVYRGQLFGPTGVTGFVHLEKRTAATPNSFKNLTDFGI
jgi:hypothetical protein